MLQGQNSRAGRAPRLSYSAAVALPPAAVLVRAAECSVWPLQPGAATWGAIVVSTLPHTQQARMACRCHWAVLGRTSPARQALHDAEARLAELQAEPLKATGAKIAACHPMAGCLNWGRSVADCVMWHNSCSYACCHAAGKALVTFAMPSGAMMCVAAAEPSLGRRAANVLLCRRAASSQLLKGEPVLVSRSVTWDRLTYCSTHANDTSASVVHSLQL